MPARLLLLSFLPRFAAQIVSLPFRDCSPAPPNISISTVYAQLAFPFLNFTVLGNSSVQIDYSSNSTKALLSTVLNPTSVLTFPVNPNSDSQSFCRTLRPPSPLPNISSDPNNAFCPLAPGPLAFAVGTQLERSYELTTLNTQIRVLDTSDPAQQLACINVDASPLRPARSVYGHAVAVFWATVALAIAYWLVVGAARLAAAWKRGRQRVHSNIWSRVQGMGFVLASAISGERFASSPALLRFGTPSMRDVVFHTQWCTLLGMLSVQWPRFAYPFFAQTAWATLLYNISITQGPDAASKHWNPLHTDPFSPPSNFADQIADPTSPLFLNTSVPNTLFTLPRDHPTTGIPALAAAVGIRPQDAFDISATLFVLIIAATLLLSLLIFAVDWSIGSLLRASSGRTSGTKSPPWSSTHKEFSDSPEPHLPDDDLASGTGVRFLHRPASRTLTLHTFPPPRGWLNYRLGQSSFHSSVLHGNLVRILTLFHLPLSIFACYQFSSGAAQSSLAAVVLAALCFALFSLALPAWLVLRLWTTPTAKLYDETRTLLMLGPLYNHYAHGSQLFAALFFATNIAYAVALGCGQESGSAQAIIVLVVEVGVALTTSVWLPWGRGAAMGGISFTFCVARIITAVLLVILSPVVSVGDSAGGWITYAILVLQGLVYLFFLFLLLAKILEGVVRAVWDVPFDRSRHGVDAGLLGAVAMVVAESSNHGKGRDGCWGRRRRRSYGTEDSTSSKGLDVLGDMRRTRRGGSESTKQMLPSSGAGSSAGNAPGQLQGHVHANAAAAQSHTTVPSVLRPEQLNQPYKEDSDDEEGYILGAWHYDEETGGEGDPETEAEGIEMNRRIAAGAEAVSPPRSPTPSRSATSTPGFSRVAGGRANLESPFTMTVKGSNTANLASGSAANIGSTALLSAENRNSMSSVGSSLNAGSMSAHLPPGAMAPGSFSHVRRQSQSAIIELADAMPNTTSATSNRKQPNTNSAASGGNGPVHTPTNREGARACPSGADASAATSGIKGRAGAPEVLHGSGLSSASGAASEKIGSGPMDGEDFQRPRLARRRRRWLGFGLFAGTSADGEDEDGAGETRAWGRRGAGSTAEAAAPMLCPLPDEGVGCASSSSSASDAAASASAASSSHASPGGGAGPLSSSSGPPPSSGTSRTFVVIRDKRPSLRPSPLSQTHTHHAQDVLGGDGGEEPTPEEDALGDASGGGRRSLVRPNRMHGTPGSSSPLAGTPSSSSISSPHASPPEVPLRSPQRKHNI